MGRSEKTTILPEPAENANSGSGQVIRAHKVSALMASAKQAESNVRVIKRSKVASFADG